MGFTGAHVLHTFDAFILALYLLSHGCALHTFDAFILALYLLSHGCALLKYKIATTILVEYSFP